MGNSEEELRRYLEQLGERMKAGDAKAIAQFVGILDILIRARSNGDNAVEEALQDWVKQTSIAAVRPNAENLSVLITRSLHELGHIFDEVRRLRNLQARITNISVPDNCGIKLAIESRAKHLVSGDFIDLIVNDQSAYLVLGDASSHGLAAAYYANAVFPVLRIHLMTADSLLEALRRANQYFHRHKPGDGTEYAAVIIAAWNFENRELHLVNTGATVKPILILDRVARFIHVEGPALGWESESKYEVVTTRLSPGDTLVWTSDGVQDQTDSSGEPYGEDRLSRTIQLHNGCDPRSLAQNIIKAVEAYSGEAIGDDQTVLVARFI